MNDLVELDRAHMPAPDADAGFEHAFPVRHRLVEHPLLTVDAVARLASRLPEGSVEHNLADVPIIVASGEAPRAHAHHADVARSIEGSRHAGSSWMVVKNIEQDPEYAALLDAVLDDVDRQMGCGLTKERREGFIFLSAPGSITPVHIDPEHNFLLQIRGTKTINIGRYPSNDVRARELERYYTGGHRNIDWLPDVSDEMALTPGDGTFVPNMAPHWVTAGDDVSVSLSVTWRPVVLDKLVSVSRFNRRLRRFGLSPRPYGTSTVTDRSKLTLVRVGRTGAQLRRAIKSRLRAGRASA